MTEPLPANQLPMDHKVLVSFEDATQNHCVDIFVRANGTFGFEAFRADLDAGVGWCSMGRHSQHLFESGEDALLEVKRLFSWVNKNETWRW